jgi:ligand-binding sensor domain-containing protein
MKFKKHLCLIFIAYKCFFVTGQTYNFKNYNTEQGLPQSQVLSVFQDHKGYIWLGTNSGGVAKFDGNTFSTFNTNNGLIDNNVFSISENASHEMLLGTSKGLTVFDGQNFKNYAEKQGLQYPLIYKLLTDANKTWIGTQEGVFIYENKLITHFNKDSLLNKSTVYNIFKDADNNLWFSTLQNGVIAYYNKSKKFKSYKIVKETGENKFIFSISQLSNKKIIIASQEGLYEINTTGELRFLNEIGGNINISSTCLLFNKNNQMYYGTQTEGLRLFDFDKNKNLANYNRLNGLASSQIYSVIKDNEGNLWIGTDGNGVYKYYNDKFVYYNKTNGFIENYVTAVNVDSENNMWVGLKNSGLVKISPNSIRSFSFDIKHNNELPDNTVNAILPLENKKMLFGTTDGLCLYDGSKFNTITENNFRHQYITSLFRDNKKTIWIGTNDGLYKMNGNAPKEATELNKHKAEGFQFPINFITEDKNGNIWIGSNNNIFSLNERGVTKYNEPNNLTGHIYSGVYDKENNLWLGTESGLFVFKGKQFVSVSKISNYPTSFINFVQLDKENKLYVGTNNGIDIIDVASFYKNQFSYKHLGKDDGLLSLESNFNASTIDKNGKLLVGTISGLEIYNPSLDKKNLNEARINILNVKLFYGEQDIYKYADGRDSITLLPKKLELPYTKNNLTFNFNGICLIAPEKVMYQYKLLGADDDWTPPINKTEVTYPSLPAGTYSFLVRATNNDGIWNKEPALFAFKILPPWYKTWWFYISCVFVLISAVLFYNNYRTKKLIADKLRLENVVNIRTKELREEKEKVEAINKEVTAQKYEIEHKNEEITDSIKYAKNIQEALLPSLTETEKALNNCFILYMPKDIVSGDFFWHTKKNNLQYIAAADCTGHGVPGAFMSIVGNTLLNEIVNDKGISLPGDILLELHKSVKSALNNKNADSERRDGMDIALCCLDRKTNTIQYSGANRPLWIFRKNKNYELEVIKPTKYPIGGLELEENRIYLNHEISVFEGDYIYIFSDGFADQFGGPRGKKFMLSNMQTQIKENLQLTMPEQKLKIQQSFTTWKGELEQVDDVLVIGIKA